MDKKFILILKENLKETKKSLEQELQKFAKKDNVLKDDWDTRYPKLGTSDSTGSQRLEESANEVEEYMTLLPIEHSLELRLQKVNNALKDIEEGSYGKCKKCGKEISNDRLMVNPEAEFCSDCQR